METQERFAATFQNVYTVRQRGSSVCWSASFSDAPLRTIVFLCPFGRLQGIPLQIPWYVTAGYHDWEGNLTAEMALNGSDVSGGRWVFPDLWHSFTVTLPPYGARLIFIRALVSLPYVAGGRLGLSVVERLPAAVIARPLRP